MDSLVVSDRCEPRDRRTEERVPAAERIHWKLEFADESIGGWLSDRSDTGVSFVSATWHQPTPGDTICLTGPAGDARRYIVTRVQPYSDSLSLVAGKLLSGTFDTEAWLAPRRPKRRGPASWRAWN